MQPGYSVGPKPLMQMGIKSLIMSRFQLKPFITWFSSLSTINKKRIINKLEEIFTIEAEPALQMKIIGLESAYKYLLQRNQSLLKENKQLEKDKNKLTTQVLKLKRDSRGLSFVDFNHLWSKLNQEEKDALKSKIVNDYYYNLLKKQHDELKLLYNILQKSHDSLVTRFVEIEKQH